MNKLLLLSLLGFALIALSAGASEENGEQSLEETESAMEEFATDELADADAKRQTRRNKGRKRNARRNRRRNGEKKNMNKTKKGRKNNQKRQTRRNKGRKKNARRNKGRKRNARRNRKRNGGKKNKNKNKKGRKTKGKRNNKKTKTRRNKGKGRATTCDLSCLDAGIKVMKVIKDKITNYKRQAIRADKQSKIGKGKLEKKDTFKGALDILIDAGGGDISNLMCSGNASNDGAKQMLNLAMPLSNCSSDIDTKCSNASFPVPPDAAEVVACLTNMKKITNMSEICLTKTGVEACDCWGDDTFTTLQASIKNCSLVAYAGAVARAKTVCVKAFGKCRTYEDAVGSQIHTCNQDSGKLTAKLGAAKANGDALGNVKNMTLALIAKSSARQTNRKKRAIATCAAFIKASTDLVASITANPLQTGVEAKTKELETFTGSCDAADLLSLNSLVAAADAGIAAVAAVMEKLQIAFVALTGAPLPDDALDAAAAIAGAGDSGGAAEASTSGRMMRRLALKNVLRKVANHA